MDNFALKPENERREVFEETASRLDVSNIIIEKDFWVCWTLKRLFSNPKLAPHLTFKGGTSLSKAYQIIDRFSEDIDLTMSREAPLLRDGKNPMEEKLSGKERKRRIDTLKLNAQKLVAEFILPILQSDIQEALGTSEGWSLSLDPDDPDQQTLLFFYPKTLNYNVASMPLLLNSTPGYIKPSVRLEFGARGEAEPRLDQTIQSYVSEAFPGLLANSDILVHTLAVERSFWEKVTILHALHHGSKIRDRMSRHYYDTYRMTQKGVADKALEQSQLLKQVVRNKSLLFKDTKASYETANLGTLKLIPKTDDLQALKKDYNAMHEMFMVEPSGFDTLMEGLHLLEDRINQKT